MKALLRQVALVMALATTAAGVAAAPGGKGSNESGAGAGSQGSSGAAEGNQSGLQGPPPGGALPGPASVTNNPRSGGGDTGEAPAPSGPPGQDLIDDILADVGSPFGDVGPSPPGPLGPQNVHGPDFADPPGAPSTDRPVDVPEPSSLALIGAALGGLALTRRRRRRH